MNRMPDLITDTVSALLDGADAVAQPLDLYTGAGTDFYERLVGPDRVEVREVLGLARVTADPVLDVAAGSGRLTIPLLRSGKQVTAIDTSRDMLSHLRRAMPDHPMLDCVVADMRDFHLGRRYGLIVLGATSVTLLDREDRSLLFARVHEHLAPHGVFSLTVAGGAAAESLASARDQEIAVPGPAGTDTYLFSQQIEEGGAVRLVNWVRASDIAAGVSVAVLTSRLHVLGHEVLSSELVEAGFAVPDVTPVRSPGGTDILLLTTSQGRSPGGTG
ncbi:daptide-type RiPP biosynthesis methyltransferase [Microbacterium oxydans]|uniref:daptide-type RiPP biosynthesis methyltransferase n=1 Tax=Microbacterium oxydans TaxID=82380 RepID=UPI00366BB1A2